MRRFLSIFLLSVALASCQTLRADGLVASSAPSEVSGHAASTIASDMVSRLAEHVGPGTGTIVLKPDASPFAGALEASLKMQGYSVISGQKTDAEKLIPLAYVIDSDDGRVLARLSTDTLDLGRVYSVTANGATPTSPLSVKRHG